MLTLCGSCKNRRFGRKYRQNHLGHKNRRSWNNLSSLLPFEVTANVVPSLPILVTLIMEAIRSLEMSVLTRVTRRNIPEDGVLHNSTRLAGMKMMFLSHSSPQIMVKWETTLLFPM
jgi:hypothetical protein